MSEAITESITKYFPDASEDASIKLQLSQLASSFAQSADDLFAKWEVFSIQTHASSYTSKSTIDAFQTYLEETQRSVQAKRQRLAPKTGPRTRFGKTQAHQSSALPKTRVVSETVSSLQPEAVTMNGIARVGLTLNTNLANFKQRPFNLRIGDASKELDEEIERVIELVLASHRLERSDLVNPEQISQGLGVAVGRIRREVPPIKQVDEAAQQWATPLTLNSAVLETSRRIGAGARAPLDFRMVHSQAAQLFEGQIVALRGKNPNGEQFIVHEILDLPRLPVARIPTSPEHDKEHTVAIAVASRPSTLEQLERFAGWITSARPSGVVLLGPLLNAELGTEANKQAVTTVLKSLGSTLGVPIVVVPSADDAFSIDSVFPQPPVALDAEKPIVPVSNPCTFSFDETAITAAAVSTLSDIHQPLAAAFKHVLRQRRLYPVYPAPPGVSIDAAHLELSALSKVAPNVLILPGADAGKSEAVVVDDVVCVAPGSLEIGSAVLITVSHGSTPLVTRTRVDSLRLVAEDEDL